MMYELMRNQAAHSMKHVYMHLSDIYAQYSSTRRACPIPLTTYAATRLPVMNGVSIVQDDLISPSYSMGLFNSDSSSIVKCTIETAIHVHVPPVLCTAELPKDFCLGLLLLHCGMPAPAKRMLEAGCTDCHATHCTVMHMAAIILRQGAVLELRSMVPWPRRYINAITALQYKRPRGIYT